VKIAARSVGSATNEAPEGAVTVASVATDASSGASAATPRRAVRDVAVQLVARAINLFLGVLVTAVVARALGGSGFGVWSTLLVVTQMAGFLADLGVEQVAVSRAAQDKRDREWIGALIVLRTLISLPATVVAGAVVLLLASDDEMLACGLVLSATLLTAGPGSSRALLQLHLRNDLNMVVITFNSLAWTASAIVLAADDAGLVAFAVAFLAATWATTGVQVAFAMRAGGVRLHGARRLLRPLAAAGIPVAVSGLLILAYARIDQVLVYELAGADEAGLYAVVYRVLEQAQFVPITVATTFLPLVASAYEVDIAKARRMTQLVLDHLAVASFPAVGFALAASEPVIELLFGRAFVEAAPALPVLMGAFVVICAGYLSGNLVIVLGLQRRFVVYAVAALVFNVGLNLALIPSYGFMAAAWVTLATEILVVGLTTAMVMRRMGHRPGLDRIVRAGLATLVMTLAVWGARQLGAGVLVLLLVGGVVYPVLAVLVRAVRIDELRALASRREPI
jgi:O-antigen/teichoic acid export membrane protein